MSVTAHCTLSGGVVSDGSCTRLKLPRPPCCGALVGLGLRLEVRVRVRVRVRVGVRVRVLRRLEAAQRVEERAQLALQRGGVVAAQLEPADGPRREGAEEARRLLRRHRPEE